MKGVRIVLASASPRRKELLEQLGWKFEVIPADVDERRLPGEAPEHLVMRLSELKGAAVRDIRPESLVVASDTIVVSEGGDIFGKPACEAEALKMLSSLQGCVHSVCTGVALFWKGRTLCRYSRARVRFRELAASDLAGYVASGDWRGKAGGYAIQGRGALMVDSIEGDCTTVIGLPLPLLGRMMEELGFTLAQIWEA